MAVVIPQRFRSECVMCHDGLDIRQPGLYRLTVGWVKQRGSDGGGNAIALAEKHNQWACATCIDTKINGPKPLALF